MKKDNPLTVEYLMKWHELDEAKANRLLEFCKKHTINYESCYGNGSIMFPKWLEANQLTEVESDSQEVLWGEVTDIATARLPYGIIMDRLKEQFTITRK